MVAQNLILTAKEVLFKTGASWDRLAPTKEDAISFAHEHINPEPIRYTGYGPFTPEYYLAHSGQSINDRFRKKIPNEKDLDVANMVASNSSNIDLVLYRGVHEPIYKLMKKEAKKCTGCDLYEKGFMSTSLVKGHEINCKTSLRIFVPSGTKLVYLGNINDEQNFYEVVIMHGAKLKIFSKDHEYINCLLLSTN